MGPVLIDLVGYPSSAAAYCVGVEDAPRALRDAGLVVRLAEAGHEVRDAGDTSTRRWRPDRERPLVQNLDDEVEGLRELVDVVAPLLAAAVSRGEGHADGPARRVLVVGGSCVVAVGLCAAAAAAGIEPHLVYVDRHLDLNTPGSTTEGSLSWMGLAHALDLDGAAPELAGIGVRRPLLAPGHLSYLGVDPTRESTRWERDELARLDLALTEQAALVADPAAAAARARAALPVGPFLVHVDVDVLDFLDAPLAENVNGRNSGPSLVDLGRALAVLWRDPDCLGVSVGQLVPAHASSDPTVLGRFLTALVPAGDRP